MNDQLCLFALKQEQYHFLYRVMEEHVIRIETQKWRPDKVSESFSPSPLLKTFTPDGSGEERLHSKPSCKRGKRRKLKRLSSDGSALQSLKRKKRGSKSVRMDQNVSIADSTTDGDKDVVDKMGKSETGPDFKRFPCALSKAAEESNARWQSPDKTRKWGYPDLSKEVSADEEKLPAKMPKSALVDTSKTEKKFDATSPAERIAEERKNCLAKQVLLPETRVKPEKPDMKPVTPKLGKYEPSDISPFCSGERRLRDQPPEVTQPSLRSPVGTGKLAPTSAPVDMHGRSAKCTQRQPSFTGTSSDELPPTSKKLPVTSPPSRMRCKCKMIPNSTRSPSRRLQCRCQMKPDSESIHSAHSDDLDKQGPVFETDAINTTVQPATAVRKAKSRKDKLELPNYGSSLKKKSNCPSESLSDEDRYRGSDKSLTQAEKQRRGLSLGREKTGFRYIDASSSEEDNVAAARRGKSPKRAGLKQPEVLVNNTSSLERRTKRKSPSRIGKYSPKFDETQCRPVSPNKKPSGAYKDVNSRTRFFKENISKRYPSRRDMDVTEAQPVEVGLMAFKERNDAYSRETNASDQFQCTSDQKGLKQFTRTSPLEGRNSPNLSRTEKKYPATYTSSQSDGLENESKLKIQKKFAARSPAEEERDRRRRSPERSSSQEDRFTRTPRMKDGNIKRPLSPYSTGFKTVSPTPSLEEKSPSVSPPRPKLQAQISPSQEPPSVSKRRKVPTALPNEREISSPKSQFTSEQRGRKSPINDTAGPKRTLSPAQLSFRGGDKSPRHRTTDRKRSRRSPSPKRNRLSSRSSSRDRSSEKSTETSNHREVSGIRGLRPSSRPNQHRVARSLGKSFETNDKDQINSAKISPPKDGTTFPADIASSKEADGNVMSSAQMSSTKLDKTLSKKPAGKTTNDEDNPPAKSETSQQPKHFHQIARATPSSVGCDIEQQVTDAQTPNVPKRIACSRPEEVRVVKGEVQPKLDNVSDLSLDTRLTVERAQARMEQKDSKVQDQKPEAKAQNISNEPQDAKQVLQMYGNQNPVQGPIPATRVANAPPPKEATVPCSARAPVAEISFDDLLDGLFYTSSVASTECGPSTDTRQPCQAGLRSGLSKAVDSSLSPEINAGIHGASPKSDASPKPGVRCCSASPAARQGFHPTDGDIPYIDDTDSGSVHELRQK